MHLKRGDQLDRYTIEAPLGEGGMGVVYRAYDPKLRRSVALKLVRARGEGPISGGRAAARLLREARAAAALVHINAVTIHDVGEAGEGAFIAMELVEGLPLRSYVGDASVAVALRLRWLGDVARALAAAHERGLTHRDIKPENVMVRRDGVVKVLDFGIASVAGEGAEPASSPEGGSRAPESWTADGHLAGTPRYMAPEQLGGEPVDARADQFAWGLVAYELLTGRPLWSGDALSLTFVADVVSDEPVATQDLADRCTPAVAAVVTKALEKRPANRFASMNDLLAALETERESARDARATAAGAPAVGGLAGPRRRVVPLPWPALALATGLALALAGTWFTATRHRAPTRDTSALPPLASGAPTTLSDLPSPESEVTEAKLAYAAGIQALRDASIVPAVRHLMRATRLDPSMAAGYVRLITHGRSLSESDERTQFAKASELRARLTPRDQALLWALEPSFVAVPPDEPEVSRRLLEIAGRWPRDAELQYLAASREADDERAERMFDGVLALDPQFALALWRKASARLARSDVAGAVSILDRCVELVPTSTACLTVRALVNEERGRCDEMEHDARVVEAINPSPRTHDLVARALLANGAPMAAVRDVLARKWAAATDQEREEYRLVDEANLALVAGDFTAAERAERTLERQAHGSAAEDDHKNVAEPLLDLYEETGQTARAASLAARYLDERVGWRSVGAWAPVPAMYGAAVRGQLRSEPQRRAAVATWRRAWANVEPMLRSQEWVLGDALPATNAQEAREALVRAPDPIPRPHVNQFHRVGIGAVGKVFLLAGRPAEALPYLRAAVATCSLLPAPIDQTRAHYNLGRALEQTGDRDGACGEYRVVLERWGAARPRSVTADKARARQVSLDCR